MKNIWKFVLAICLVLLCLILVKLFYPDYTIVKAKDSISIPSKIAPNKGEINVLPSWQIVKTKDEFTDKSVTYVFFEDADYRVQISNESPAIWIYISTKNGPMFENYGELEFRVDDNATRTFTKEGITLLEKYGSKVYSWEPRTIGMHIFHGGQLNKGADDASCGLLTELMKGKELKVRYQVNSLSKKSFKVNIQGLRPLVVEAFGLDYCAV